MKKVISLVLSVLMAFSLCTVAFAQQDVTPVIVVSGMGSFPLYLEQVSDSSQVFAPAAKDILKAIGGCIVPIGKAVISSDSAVFVDGAAAVANQLFDYISCNPDGTSKYSVVAPTFPKSVDNYESDFYNSEKNDDEVGITKALVDKIGAENVYYFNYDWRLDPLDHAVALKEMVDNVRKERSCSEVTLIPASMGGCVVMSYLYKYGSEGIKSIIMTETAVLGTSIVGELFTKEISISTDTLLEYFYTFFQDEGFLYQTLFGILASCIDLSLIDVEKTLDKLFASIVAMLSDALYADVLVNSFAAMPGIWALMPRSYYKTAKTAIYPEGMNKALMKRTDLYQNKVQANAEKLLKTAEAQGTDIYFLAAYGYVGFPATKKAMNQCDCLIDTCYESFNATCAPYGEFLGQDYKALGTVCNNAEHHHVSTDGIIDASTCLLPERTWFIKGNRHVGIGYKTGASDLMMFLATADSGVDVHTDEAFPQSTKLNRFSGKLTSLTGGEIKRELTDSHSDLLSRIINFLMGLVEYLKNMVKL